MREGLFYRVLPVKLDQYTSNLRLVPEDLASKLLELIMVKSRTSVNYEPWNML